MKDAPALLLRQRRGAVDGPGPFITMYVPVSWAFKMEVSIVGGKLSLGKSMRIEDMEIEMEVLMPMKKGTKKSRSGRRQVAMGN